MRRYRKKFSENKFLYFGSVSKYFKNTNINNYDLIRNSVKKHPDIRIRIKKAINESRFLAKKVRRDLCFFYLMGLFW